MLVDKTKEITELKKQNQQYTHEIETMMHINQTMQKQISTLEKECSENSVRED